MVEALQLETGGGISNGVALPSLRLDQPMPSLQKSTHA